MRKELASPEDSMIESWIEEHINSKANLGEHKEFWDAVKWLKERPTKIKELILKFPPLAVVESVEEKELVCPAPGKHGIVIGYFGSNDTELLINVVDPETHTAAQCKPEWIRVTHYCGLLTPDRLRIYMAGGVA